MSNEVKEYIDYLQRVIRNTNMTIQDANQLAACREVAKAYGLSKEQILEIG